MTIMDVDFNDNLFGDAKEMANNRLNEEKQKEKYEKI